MRIGGSGTLREVLRGASLALCCALATFGFAQLASAQLIGADVGNTSTANTSAPSATAVVRTLQGQVVNALDGAPVPRVLVTINGRAALTDSQGRYEFAGFTDSTASVKLLKPGYSDNNDQTLGNSVRKLADLDSPAHLKLYPDAIITGTVTGRDGLPLTGIPITLKRAFYGPNGITWAAAGSIQTNLHGEYRFRQPAGRFQIAASYVARCKDTGEAVLPVSYPENGGNGVPSFFETAPGEEKHIDLRPRTGPQHKIPFRLDPPDAGRGAQLSASTSAGDWFFLEGSGGGMGPGSRSSDTWQAELPAGSYTVQARIENRDTSLYGSTKLTVTGPRTDPVVIHLQPGAALPVEIALDQNSADAASAVSGAATGAQPVAAPDPRQFNLHLHNAVSNSPSTQDIAPRQEDDKSYEFRVPPGRYRLQANQGGAWYIESATYGTSNLMTDEVAISSGGSGFPIRLVVNNTFGMVTGTVRFPESSNDPIDVLYVYLIPVGPSLGAINPISVTNSGTTTGTFSMRLPVGSYLALAVDSRLQLDPRDPDVQARFSTAAKPLAILTSATASVELDVAQMKEPGK